MGLGSPFQTPPRKNMNTSKSRLKLNLDPLIIPEWPYSRITAELESPNSAQQQQQQQQQQLSSPTKPQAPKKQQTQFTPNMLIQNPDNSDNAGASLDLHLRLNLSLYLPTSEADDFPRASQETSPTVLAASKKKQRKQRKDIFRQSLFADLNEMSHIPISIQGMSYDPAASDATGDEEVVKTPAPSPALSPSPVGSGAGRVEKARGLFSRHFAKHLRRVKGRKEKRKF